MVTMKRWHATISSALCMAAGMSAVFMGSFPIFLGPVSKDLGWGLATFPQFITASSILAALLMPACGRLVDRMGARWPVAFGLALVAAGLFLLSFLASAGPVFWMAALCVGAGSALSGPPAFVGLISSWFDRNRALAIGCILSVAPACGQAIISPLTQHLISELGWRSAYRCLAAVTFTAALVAAVGFLRAQADGPAGPVPGTPSASAGEALKTPTFWLLAIGSCLGSGTILGLTVHVVTWQTGRGIAPELAALVLSVLFIAGMAGAFLAGFAADRARSIHVLQMFYLLPLGGLALMAASSAAPALVLGAALIGIAMGATTGLAPFLATRYFGIKASSEIFGIILAMTMVALGVVPLLIGIGYDATGGYSWPLSMAGAAILLSAICIGLLDYSSRHLPASRTVAKDPIMGEK